jgi:hypothetical protein
MLEKLTVLAFGSKSLKSSFLAPDENQDGQENSALYIFLYKFKRFGSSKGK